MPWLLKASCSNRSTRATAFVASAPAPQVESVSSVKVAASWTASGPASNSRIAESLIVADPGALGEWSAVISRHYMKSESIATSARRRPLSIPRTSLGAVRGEPVELDAYHVLTMSHLIHDVTQTSDPGEAHEAVRRAYLPHRLELMQDSTPLQMRLDVYRFGSSTAGRLSYGRKVRVLTDDAQDYHINVPLRGRTVSRCGTFGPVQTSPTRAAVFIPGRPADIVWDGDCSQMCLMIPRATLEKELEQLLPRPPRTPIRFEGPLDLSTAPGQSWRDLLNVLDRECDAPSGLATHVLAGRRLEQLILDGLLLAHPHNYTEALEANARPALPRTVRRAMELLEEQPRREWTTSSLAAELFISVRSLQDGFRRHLGRPPMVYLREVRLGRVRDELLQADPDAATIGSIAVRWGFLHLGRFAALYRSTFDEYPSATLHRTTYPASLRGR